MQIKRKGFTLNIFEDTIESPRIYYEDTNKTKMICFSRKYNLGDEHDFKNPLEFKKWYEKHKEEICCIKPLYLYNHSGLSISTTPYNDKFDSGQIGYVYCLKSDFIEDEKLLDNKIIENQLEEEINDYDLWLNNIPPYYSFEITDENDDRIECMGVFEYNGLKEMIEEMKERSEHQYDFLFNAYLEKENENCL